MVSRMREPSHPRWKLSSNNEAPKQRFHGCVCVGGGGGGGASTTRFTRVKKEVNEFPSLCRVWNDRWNSIYNIMFHWHFLIYCCWYCVRTRKLKKKSISVHHLSQHFAWLLQKHILPQIRNSIFPSQITGKSWLIGKPFHVSGPKFKTIGQITRPENILYPLFTLRVVLTIQATIG